MSTLNWSDSNLAAVPSNAGTYALLFMLPEPKIIRIGENRRAQLAPGWYIYCGSAFGPGGLRARLGRHLRGDGKRHWHIDALRAAVAPQGAYWVAGGSHLECAWAHRLAAQAGAFIPLKRFGASDCRSGCPAHLIGFSQDFWVPTRIESVLY